MNRDDRLRRAIRHWYAKAARPLPWRESPDPYAVWVSEVMLQQTRVDTVLRFYRPFLARFPSVAALARAGETEVLRLWSGLGYYGRARNLHAAARRVMEEHGGIVPRDRADFRALPGAGNYTTAAVLSIAYGIPLAAVDGNVRRVLSRIDDLEKPSARMLEERAMILLDRRDPGGWNQALMELGAVVCTPRDPRCGECPVADACRARARGTVALRPAPNRRVAARIVPLLAVWDEAEEGVLLWRRRPPALRAIWRGLWMVPLVPWSAGEDEGEIAALIQRLGRGRWSLEHVARTDPMAWVLTHRRLELTPVMVRQALPGRPADAGGDGELRRRRGDWGDLPTPAALDRLCRTVPPPGPFPGR